MKLCPKCSKSLESGAWLCVCGYEFSGSEQVIPSTPEQKLRPRLRTILGSCLLAGFIGALAAHLCGYKIYGSAVTYDNRPVLTAPQELTSLAAPNVLVISDGSRIEVRGVAFSPALLAMSHKDLQRLLRSSEQILVQLDSTPSGVSFQHRNLYWCGNTFFPTFFPDRLPQYDKEDFGRYLTQYQLATTP